MAALQRAFSFSAVAIAASSASRASSSFLSSSILQLLSSFSFCFAVNASLHAALYMSIVCFSSSFSLLISVSTSSFVPYKHVHTLVQIMAVQNVLGNQNFPGSKHTHSNSGLSLFMHTMPCEDQEQDVLPLSIVKETSCSEVRSLNLGPRKDPSELVESLEVRPWSM